MNVKSQKQGSSLNAENPCPTRDSVYNLCDFDWVCANFEHDFGLEMRMAYLQVSAGKTRLQAFWILYQSTTDTSVQPSPRVCESSTRSKQFAVASKQGVSSTYSLTAMEAITKAIDDGWRFDQQFVDFMRSKGLPVVDLMQAHDADFARFNIGLAQYLRRYFIGHYNPLGNFFTALALKDKLVEVLEPKPLPYQGVS